VRGNDDDDDGITENVWNSEFVYWFHPVDRPQQVTESDDKIKAVGLHILKDEKEK